MAAESSRSGTAPTMSIGLVPARDLLAPSLAIRAGLRLTTPDTGPDNAGGSQGRGTPLISTEIDIAADLVGDTGIEPVTSSV
jgi:hypothetical protein